MNKLTISVSPASQKLLTPNSINYLSSKLPTLAFCISSLQSCAQQNNLKQGKQLHAHILRNGHFISSPQSTTSLINMYSKCNTISNALNIFFTSPYAQNIYACNAIIAGLITNDLPKQTLEIYSNMRMVHGIVPDKYTFPCVIKACFNVVEVKKIYASVFKLGLDSDLFIGSALVNGYLKFGLVVDALKVFDELPDRNDVVLWNALIIGFSQIRKFDKSIEVFRSMIETGVIPSRFTVTGILSVLGIMEDFCNGWVMHCFVIKMGYDSGVAILNALIDMYGKCKRVHEALNIFEEMNERDIFSWNSIICVHEQCGYHERSLKLFKRMLFDGVIPDLITITSVLPACARLADLMHGKEIHSYMIVNGWVGNSDSRIYNDKFIENSVMDMYAKCGSMKEANFVFNTMNYKDVASWNIMMMGYGMRGYGKEALYVFYEMCESGIKPDDVTFVGVLSACSHSGLVKQGQNFLEEMEVKYGITPAIEHYTCVVDMLGRAGELEEAYKVLLTMPIQDNSVVWRAFLASCKHHGNEELAEIAAKRVLSIEPEHCGSYVMLSNIYGAKGCYKEVQEVRDSMREHNVMKTPGRSWIG